MRREAIGFCKNWNPKGFGFIELLEGENKGKTVFLHYSKMYSFYNKSLLKDEIVTVAYEESTKGLQAVDCWSNVYGYIHTNNFRYFEEKYCDTIINFNTVPKDICVHKTHINTLADYKKMLTEEEALKHNIEAILAYSNHDKDSWFSGESYSITIEESSREITNKTVFVNNKSYDFLMMNPFTNKAIFIIKNYGDFNIEEYWNKRKAIV